MASLCILDTAIIKLSMPNGLDEVPPTYSRLVSDNCRQEFGKKSHMLKNANGVV